MKRRLVIAGGSGFLGRSLIRLARDHFDEIVVLTRSPGPSSDARQVGWDARTVGPWRDEIEGAAAVVNFVGKSVDCIKTDANKELILRSRIDSVDALGKAIASCNTPPPVWIQSGTAHIFGDTDDQVLDESSPIGKGLAPEVGVAWERHLADAPTPATRKVNLRISFVLGADGGALTRLGALARWFLGGRVGHGRQWISWIHERDLSRIVLRAIVDPTMHGTYVATSPNPVRNAEFMAELRRAVRRPWSPPAPAWAVKIAAPLVLRTDPELALLGRRCVPTRLLAEGFHFDFAELRTSLDAIYSHRSAVLSPD